MPEKYKNPHERMSEGVAYVNRTREELVEVMAEGMWNSRHLTDWRCIEEKYPVKSENTKRKYRRLASAALSALVAIGEVNIRGGIEK